MKLGATGLCVALGLALASTWSSAADDETRERSAEHRALVDVLRDLEIDDDVEIELQLDSDTKFTVVDEIVRYAQGLASALGDDVGKEVKVKLKSRDNESDEADDEVEGERDDPKPENFIGVITRPVPDAIAHQLSAHLEKDEGLVVVRVLPESPAAKAGVEEHDVLVSYAGTKLSNPEQLRKLIVESKAESAVEVELLRAAKLQTVKLTVATRARGSKILKLDLPERAFEFRLPKGLGDVEQKKIIVRQKLDKLREERIRDELKRLKEIPKPKVDGVKISITSGDGKGYKVEVAFKNEQGERQELSFEGSIEELLESIGELPEAIRDRVAGSLKRLQHEDEADDEDADEKRAFRFQFQPHLEEGGKRGFRIFIRRPGEGGKPRVFEFDQSVTLDLEDLDEHLLELQEVREELEELGPVIRARIEETLRNIHIPEVQVEIEDDSQ